MNGSFTFPTVISTTFTKPPISARRKPSGWRNCSRALALLPREGLADPLHRRRMGSEQELDQRRRIRVRDVPPGELLLELDQPPWVVGELQGEGVRPRGLIELQEKLARRNV